MYSVIKCSLYSRGYNSEKSLKEPRMCTVYVKVHHKTYGRLGGNFLQLLTLATDGDEWSASCPLLLYSRYPLNRGLGGPMIWSGCFGKQLNILLLSGIEPKLLVMQLVA